MTFKRLLKLVIPILIWVYVSIAFIPLSKAQYTNERQNALSQRMDALSQRVSVAEAQNYPQRLAILETKLDAHGKTLDKIEGWAERLAIAILYLMGDSIVKLFNFVARKRDV